jgi:hypothetical protein
MSNKDVAPSVVDKVAQKIKESSPNLSSEKARQIARESAERINRERRERGK